MTPDCVDGQVQRGGAFAVCTSDMGGEVLADRLAVLMADLHARTSTPFGGEVTTGWIAGLSVINTWGHGGNSLRGGTDFALGFCMSLDVHARSGDGLLGGSNIHPIEPCPVGALIVAHRAERPFRF